MSASRLDAVYRSILLTKFFTKGWGKPENLRRLFEFRKVVSNRDECFKLVEKNYPITITKEQNLSDCKVLEGYFVTPLERYLPGIVPEIAQKAHFQVILPTHWAEADCKPVCLHLAGTGDHFFWRRRNLMVKPLLKEAGIGGIILENPFYGLRKPTDQIRSALHNVSDIFVMGGCLILESLVLFHWCERNGLGPLGVTGLSMGGHMHIPTANLKYFAEPFILNTFLKMASLAATNWPKPLVLVPCLSWSTASAVFLQGVMSHSINWDLLEDQYLSDGDYREKLSKMVTIVDEAFLAGKKFARTYSEKMDNIDTKTQVKPETVNSEKCDNNLDITFKESNGASETQSVIVDVTEKVLELNEKVPKNTVKSESIAQIVNLDEELKKLLKEKKISQVLYDKLSSNKKFELNSNDIDEINKLTEEKLKELLLKCKVADIKCESLLYTDNKEDKPNANNAVLQNSSTINVNPSTLDNNSKVVVNEKPSVQGTKDSEDILLAETDKSKGKEKTSWSISDLTSDFWLNLPFVRSSGKKIDIGKINWRDREALQFMRGIMDECTHLSNFSVPYDTSLIIAVCAKHDAYVPRDDVGTLEEIWPGAEVRYVDAGHISAYILHQSMFRSCIVEAFERSKKKWKNEKHIK